VRSRAARGPTRRAGRDDRLRRLDRPVDRPALALRVPRERSTHQPATQGHGIGHSGSPDSPGRIRLSAAPARHAARAARLPARRSDRRRARRLISSTSVELYPAVDVQGGRVVRLRQGEARHATAYADDPVAVARQFARDGARWVHFVDLDRAFGKGDNRELARRFLGAAEVPVQVGGGLRTEEAIGLDTIASGGVASLADLQAIRAAGLAGAIVGRALYEGRFTLGEALECAAA